MAGILDVPVISIGVHQKLKLASQLFTKSLFLEDTFETNEMMRLIEKSNELPENNFDHLYEKEKQCKRQYALIKKWIETNEI